MMFDVYFLIFLGICWLIVGGLFVMLCEDDDVYEFDSLCSCLLKSIILMGKGIKEIEFDEKNNRLFIFLICVVQNKNIDICVIDMKDMDIGEFYILFFDGIWRVIYCGIEMDQNLFCLCVVECDFDYNCIVFDIFNSLFYVFYCIG